METVAAATVPPAVSSPRRSSESANVGTSLECGSTTLSRRSLRSARARQGYRPGLISAALGGAGVRARPCAAVDRQLLARANADLNRVGNNINQIAHALNAGRDVPQSLAGGPRPLFQRDVKFVLRGRPTPEDILRTGEAVGNTCLNQRTLTRSFYFFPFLIA